MDAGLKSFLNVLSGQQTFADWWADFREKRRRQSEVIRIAEKAMAQVGVSPDAFTLRDIGLLAYRNLRHPRLIRTQPVMTDTRYLRPFTEVSASRRGAVELEIYDSDDNLLYTDQTLVPRGITRIIPGTWLPLESTTAAPGEWALVVRIEGNVFAVHFFSWHSISRNPIVDDLRTDGELNDDLRQMVRQGRFRPMTLDELLADQEE